jgi:hypothetical protein
MSHPPPIVPDPYDEPGPAADEFARALAEFERGARPAAMAARAAATRVPATTSAAVIS